MRLFVTVADCSVLQEILWSKKMETVGAADTP